MKILFENIRIPEEYGFADEHIYVLTDGEYISYIGREKPEDYDRTIDGHGNLLIPGFYNSHCHASMVMFRGYGEDLPLSRWLNEKIFPAEERLNERNVYVSAKYAIAEMLKNGIVSFSDMYMFEDSVAKAVLETGIKANLSRSLVSFGDGATIKGDWRFEESVRWINEYHNANGGKLKFDMSIHAEYTNRASYIREVAEYTKEHGLRMQIHASESESEHAECIGRHGKTPIEFLLDTGVLASPTTLAHCVYVTDSDMDIIRENGAFVSHNATSNLKLGSGVARLPKMLEKGVCVSLGTDGAASNNTLDIMREYQLVSILHKGYNRDAEATKAPQMLDLATLNGAKSQGRDDCGKLKVGNRADLVMIDLGAINNKPCFDTYATLSYSANSSNVLMTMVDGEILYRNGEFTTIDIEKVRYDFDDICEHYFD
ncbi:MAG: amidohydrolase [Eubacteriales bacterium]